MKNIFEIRLFLSRFIFLTMIEVAFVCYLDSENNLRRKERQAEKKKERVAVLQRFEILFFFDQISIKKLKVFRKKDRKKNNYGATTVTNANAAESDLRSNYDEPFSVRLLIFFIILNVLSFSRTGLQAIKFQFLDKRTICSNLCTLSHNSVLLNKFVHRLFSKYYFSRTPHG